MKWLISAVCLFSSLFVQAQPTTQPAAEKRTRVLIVTGCDVPAHNWRETTPALREALEASKDFEVVVSEEPLVLESSALEHYDVVMLNYFADKRPGHTEKARKNLTSFVKGGKGLVCFHYSARTSGEWPEYRDLVGRIWIPGTSGHGPRGKFTVHVADPKHFITEGLEDFEADDELYARLQGDAPIHVLLTADSAWSGRTEPLAWTLDVGKGRVFGFMLGHDARACRIPAFVRLLQRGTLWAAGHEGR